MCVQSGGCGFARRVEAVTDLCLRVEKNEIFGFIGHNGAGKTTLLSLLSGALPATRCCALPAPPGRNSTTLILNENMHSDLAETIWIKNSPLFVMSQPVGCAY